MIRPSALGCAYFILEKCYSVPSSCKHIGRMKHLGSFCILGAKTASDLMVFVDFEENVYGAAVNIFEWLNDMIRKSLLGELTR